MLTKVNRHDQILLSLDNLTYATSDQLQTINNLGGDRNTRRILFDMESDGLIKSTMRKRKIYYISAKGSERIGAAPGTLKKSWITHSLMRNELYIKLGLPDDWQTETPVKFNSETLIPDAMYREKGIYHFVEIDNTQAMKINYEKIKKYRMLFAALFRKYRQHPVLIWYTGSTIRKEKLKDSCQNAGIKHNVFSTYITFKG